MGINCSSRRSSASTSKSMSNSLNTALEYCDSTSLANSMRAKPDNHFLSTLIEKQGFQIDCVELLIQKIEQKGSIILRCYNQNTSNALKIKQRISDYYQEFFQPYRAQVASQDAIILKETQQIIIETLIIINCLMDKKFDPETELWWSENYYKERLTYFQVGSNQEEPDPMLRGIFQMVDSLSEVIGIKINKQPVQTLGNSVSLANQHLTQFYNGMKLDFVKN